MPETWVYVVGGIIIALIGFVIAFNFMSRVIDSAQSQGTLQEFEKFRTDINSACLQEVNNSIFTSLSLNSIVRSVYSTDYVKCDNDNACNFPKSKCINGDCLLLKTTDLIKNKEISYGYNVCLQFKDENSLRCSKTFCNVSMFYMGALPEGEDLLLRVQKILGQAPIKEYKLCISKADSKQVSVKECLGLTLLNETTS